MTVRYLMDTCAWIELATDGPGMAHFAPYFQDLAAIVVPTIVQFELYKWVCRERDEAMALEFIGLSEQGRVVPLDTSLALQAADHAATYRLAMADAMVYATAWAFRVPLVTCDAHFAALPGVEYFAPSG